MTAWPRDHRPGAAAPVELDRGTTAIEDDPPSSWWFVPLVLVPSFVVLFMAFVVFGTRGNDAWRPFALLFGALAYRGVLGAAGMVERARSMQDGRVLLVLVGLVAAAWVLATTVAPTRATELFYGVGMPVVFLVAAIADVRSPVTQAPTRPTRPVHRWIGPRAPAVSLVLLTVIPSVAGLVAMWIGDLVMGDHGEAFALVMIGLLAWAWLAEDLGLLDGRSGRQAVAAVTVWFGTVYLMLWLLTWLASDPPELVFDLLLWPVAYLVLSLVTIRRAGTTRAASPSRAS